MALDSYDRVSSFSPAALFTRITNFFLSPLLYQFKTSVISEELGPSLPFIQHPGGPIHRHSFHAHLFAILMQNISGSLVGWKTAHCAVHTRLHLTHWTSLSIKYFFQNDYSKSTSDALLDSGPPTFLDYINLNILTMSNFNVINS